MRTSNVNSTHVNQAVAVKPTGDDDNIFTKAFDKFVQVITPVPDDDVEKAHKKGSSSDDRATTPIFESCCSGSIAKHSIPVEQVQKQMADAFGTFAEAMAPVIESDDIVRVASSNNTSTNATTRGVDISSNAVSQQHEEEQLVKSFHQFVEDVQKKMTAAIDTFAVAISPVPEDDDEAGGAASTKNKGATIASRGITNSTSKAVSKQQEDAIVNAFRKFVDDIQKQLTDGTANFVDAITPVSDGSDKVVVVTTSNNRSATTATTRKEEIDALNVVSKPDVVEGFVKAVHQFADDIKVQTTDAVDKFVDAITPVPDNDEVVGTTSNNKVVKASTKESVTGEVVVTTPKVVTATKKEIATTEVVLTPQTVVGFVKALHQFAEDVKEKTTDAVDKFMDAVTPVPDGEVVVTTTSNKKVVTSTTKKIDTTTKVVSKQHTTEGFTKAFHQFVEDVQEKMTESMDTFVDRISPVPDSETVVTTSNNKDTPAKAISLQHNSNNERFSNAFNQFVDAITPVPDSDVAAITASNGKSISTPGTQTYTSKTILRSVTKRKPPVTSIRVVYSF